MVKAAPNEDRTEQFQRLWGILDRMHAKIQDRFELTRDPAEIVELFLSLKKYLETKGRRMCHGGKTPLEMAIKHCKGTDYRILEELLS